MNACLREPFWYVSMVFQAVWSRLSPYFSEAQSSPNTLGETKKLGLGNKKRYN